MSSHHHPLSRAKSPIWSRILSVPGLAIILIGNLPVLAVVYLIRLVVDRSAFAGPQVGGGERTSPAACKPRQGAPDHRPQAAQ